MSSRDSSINIPSVVGASDQAWGDYSLGQHFLHKLVSLPEKDGEHLRQRRFMPWESNLPWAASVAGPHRDSRVACTYVCVYAHMCTFM